MDAKALRASTRARRRELSEDQIAAASLAITERVWRLPPMSRCRRIAAYLSIGGEVDCQYLIQDAWDRNRIVCLPVLNGQELLFAPFLPTSNLLRNRHGIPEPITSNRQFFRPNQMDVVLTPLVIFDEHGIRLGMGGGYYDRSFRFMLQRGKWMRPRLVGLAYEFQKVAELKASSWDVPLNTVVTDRKIYYFR